MPTKIKDNTKAEGKNLFGTPHYATHIVMRYLKPYTMVWECAAGEGHMVRALEKRHAVWATDIDVAPKGIVVSNERWDFLTQTRDEKWMKQFSYIVTNPPFDYKIQFYQKCMDYWKQYGIPFALLVPADYSGWIIKAVREDMCQKIIPTRRIDYITPTGLHGGNGHTSRFHSMWLVKGLNIEIPKPILPSEIYVPLSLKAKKENIFDDEQPVVPTPAETEQSDPE